MAAVEISKTDPETFSQAMRCKESKKWRLAMNEEIESLHKNQTWEVVKRPIDKSTVDCKWIFKVKE